MVKIFIGNIPEGAQSDELQSMFEKYGPVSECDILGNFGFAHMGSESDANAAVKGLDGAFFAGGTIKVEVSHGKSLRGGRGGRGGFFDRGDRGGSFRGRGGGSFRGGRDDDSGYRGRDVGAAFRDRDRDRLRERFEDYPPPREREYYARPDPYDRDPYARDPYRRSDPYARDPYARDPYERRPPPRDLYERRSRDPYASYTTARDPYPPRDPYASRPVERLERHDPYPPPRDRSPLGAREFGSGREFVGRDYGHSKRPYDGGYELRGRSGSPPPSMPRRY